MHCVANTELKIDCLHPKLVALASFLQVSFILTELENEVFFARKTYKRERHLVGAASSGVHTISAVVLNPSLYFKCLNLESKVAFHFLGVQGGY